MNQRYEGRLELTWTNKPLRLLAFDDGSYEWVNPSDYRVAEVRLLNDADSIGVVSKRRSADNLMIQGDALNALTSLSRLPEFAKEYLGKVKLAYLDPPFNTQQSFLQYDDALEHSVWLTMMRDRLLQIKDLLSPDGSVWVHCDDSEQAYLRVLMDEIWGRNCFVTTVMWEKRFSRSNDATFSVSHDYIVIFATDPGRWSGVRNRLTRSAEQSKIYKNPDGDPRGPWRTVPWDAPNIRVNLSYPITTPSGKVRYPPKGRHWSRTEEQWLRLHEQGLTYFGKKGDGSPMIKMFIKDDPGIVPNTWWSHEECGHTAESKKEIMNLFPGVEPFATPKPERLMQRIVEIGSDEGDIVLDAFAGSGSTLAVAHKMGRRWIAIERERDTLETFMKPRLTKIVAGEDPGGVTDLVEWKGGAGFRVLEVAPSMFDSENGLVFLADWMTNGSLAEAVAAQLGFDFESNSPFVGRKGRSRLAVIDGVVNEGVVRLVVGALPEQERVVICGTGIVPEARSILRELRPGSTLRKIPAALLDEYRANRQLELPMEPVSQTNSLGAVAVTTQAGD
jgi:adenine-specific DNA-methyltransferase